MKKFITASLLALLITASFEASARQSSNMCIESMQSMFQPNTDAVKDTKDIVFAANLIVEYNHHATDHKLTIDGQQASLSRLLSSTNIDAAILIAEEWENKEEKEKEKYKNNLSKYAETLLENQNVLIAEMAQEIVSLSKTDEISRLMLEGVLKTDRLKKVKKLQKLYNDFKDFDQITNNNFRGSIVGFEFSDFVNFIADQSAVPLTIAESILDNLFCKAFTVENNGKEVVKSILFRPLNDKLVDELRKRFKKYVK